MNVIKTLSKSNLKRLIFLSAIIIAIRFNTVAFAENGDVIGYVYSSDILTFINDVPVPSYNIGGKTVIILEDLIENEAPSYGIFDMYCVYIDELRVLYAGLRFIAGDNIVIERGEVGEVIGEVYKTDITTYFNGKPIPSYSLNGKMAVAIEDLGTATDENTEYSPYGMRYVWNAEDRTIHLYFLYPNSVYQILREKSLSLSFVNDKADIYIDYFQSGSESGMYKPDFNPPSDFPVYYKDQRIGTGFKSGDGAYIQHDSTGNVMLVEEERYYNDIFYDIDAVKSVVDAIVVPPPTYEQVLQYYTVDIWGTVWDRIDTDICTFLHIILRGNHGSSEALVRIARNGEYYDYSKIFESSNIWGVINFENVRIENDKVFFRYDTDYVIDLNSGEMHSK